MCYALIVNFCTEFLKNTPEKLYLYNDEENHDRFEELAIVEAFIGGDVTLYINAVV